MDIKIKFTNLSDEANPNIVLFHKSVPDASERVIAWKVIGNCGTGQAYTFDYPAGYYICVKDPWGNVSNWQQVKNGQRWDVVLSPSGDILTLDQMPVADENAVEVKNCLLQGPIEVYLYKDDKLVASQTGIFRNQMACFRLEPVMWAGVMPQAKEGDIISLANVSGITQIPLKNITGAELIVSGSSESSYAFIVNPVS